MSFTANSKKLLFVLADAISTSRSFSTRSAGLKAEPKYTTYTSIIEQNDQTDADFQPYLGDPIRKEHTARLHATTKRYSPSAQPGKMDQAGITTSWDKDRRAKGLEALQYRRWKQGDVYAPHDLSPVELKKWRTRSKPTTDVFDVLAINPLNEYKNYSMMSEFMTPLGRIKHPRDTGLRNVNQRRIAKAIRRAIGMGLMPSVHKHPEMLRRGR